MCYSITSANPPLTEWKMRSEQTFLNQWLYYIDYTRQICIIKLFPLSGDSSIICVLNQVLYFSFKTPSAVVSRTQGQMCPSHKVAHSSVISLQVWNNIGFSLLLMLDLLTIIFINGERNFSTTLNTILRYLYFSSLILCYTLYFHVINLKALVIRHFKIKVLQNNICNKLLKYNKDETSGFPSGFSKIIAKVQVA